MTIPCGLTNKSKWPCSKNQNYSLNLQEYIFLRLNKTWHQKIRTSTRFNLQGSLCMSFWVFNCATNTLCADWVIGVWCRVVKGLLFFHQILKEVGGADDWWYKKFLPLCSCNMTDLMMYSRNKTFLNHCTASNYTSVWKCVDGLNIKHTGTNLEMSTEIWPTYRWKNPVFASDAYFLNQQKLVPVY